MRVAVICAHTCPLAPLGGWETGGMNVYVRELGRELGAQGAQVDIFTRRQACESPDVVEYAPGARVIHLDCGPSRPVDKYDVLDYLPDFACGIQRWRALTGMSYDVIHGHYWLSGRIATLFREHWGVPMAATFHTLAPMKNTVAASAAEREQQVRYDIERRTMATADRLIASTEVDRAHILRYYGDGPIAPITVIPGGVDLDRFRPVARAAARAEIGISERHVLLFVGRIQRLKGLDILMRAFHVVRRSRANPADIRVLVVGGLPAPSAGRPTPEMRELARLKRLAARLGIDEQVTFVGAVQQDRLPYYYAAADVAVVPSSYESFGLVAVEALACGTPVVASRVGGLTTIVRDGETGFLVPWRDPRLFADRLAEILDDEELQARMAARARASVERFGWSRIAAQHRDLYATLVAGRRGRLAAGSHLVR